MPYFVVDDWSGGLDLRRLPIVSSPTTLLQLDNAHIDQGGAIEKRKAFVNYANAAGTFGLATVKDGLTVFGNQAANPLPPGSPLSYQLLDPAQGDTITGIVDWDLFDGLLYVVGVNDAGSYFHFYDGAYVPSGIGKQIRTFDEKVYSVLDKDVNFCATGDPTDWAGTGSGTINLSTQDAESFELEGLEVYYDRLAVLSRRTTQTWFMDPDPLQNRKDQVLRSAGTRAGRSVLQYGGGDVLYLDDSGVRSLRARDSSNSASVSDIGSPLDKLLQGNSSPNAFAVEERGNGRFWLYLDGIIYVLSFFPGPKVTAWSRYLPDIPATDLVSVGLTVAIRSEDNNIYLYGGEDYQTYDSAKVVAQTAFLNMNEPATVKEFQAMDIAGTNLWSVEFNLTPPMPGVDLESLWEVSGLYEGTTYPQQQMSVGGSSTHIAYRLTCEDPGAAILANLTTHYESGDAS